MSKKTKARQRAAPIDPGSAEPIILAFGKDIVDAEEDPRLNLSAVAAVGSTLFVADDEAPAVHRFMWNDKKKRFADRLTFSLADFFDLPEVDDEEVPGEMDIEGLEVTADGALWIVGSHSLARKKPKDDAAETETIDRLAGLKFEANRHFLGRLPLVTGEDGKPTPTKDGAAALEMGRDCGRLTSLLAHDPHLAPSIAMPAKENGFDIEGLAVRGEKAFVGLRGPVLRGWAVLLELAPKLLSDGRLDLAPVEPWRRYRKHFLDLRGLGVRELAVDPDEPDDLLILAGPSMDLDGPVLLFRWTGAFSQTGERIVDDARELGTPMAIPFGNGFDHPEGVCLLPEAASNGRRSLLILPDSPANGRLDARGHFTADALPLLV